MDDKYYVIKEVEMAARIHEILDWRSVISDCYSYYFIYSILAPTLLKAYFRLSCDENQWTHNTAPK